jgi:ech hydrogenase subunit D
MLQNFMVVEKQNLLDEIKKTKAEGYRFAAMTCEHESDTLELTYHFDLNYQMKNIRLVINRNEPMESISSIYGPAFLIENEFQDLYGVVFTGLIIDYKGNLYLSEDAPKAPMLKAEK